MFCWRGKGREAFGGKAPRVISTTEEIRTDLRKRCFPRANAKEPFSRSKQSHCISARGTNQEFLRMAMKA